MAAIRGNHPYTIAIAVESQTDFRIGSFQYAESGPAGFRVRKDQDGDGEKYHRSRNTVPVPRIPVDDIVRVRKRPVTPLPQSIAIFMGRASLMSLVMRWRYVSAMSCLR